MSILDAARTRLRLVFARRAAESRVDEEIRFHIEMETERLVRNEGLTRVEARRQALVAFGGVEKHKEALRDGRGLAWLGGMSLDFKLGLRMLVKHPGLTVVGIVGMAVAVAIGAVAFSGIRTIIDSSLPLNEGDRIVAIQNLDTRVSDEGRRTHLHDLGTWRDALRTVEDIGAYRTIDRNVITGDGRPESMRVAEMSASGFRVARVPPLLGRYTNDDDERVGAPAVVVIGYDVWQSRFGGRGDVVGQTLDLGSERHTVIGVMPKGFAFPINNRVWTPLRLSPSDFERGHAPPIDVFGRLAQSATLADAQRQLTTIGQRLAVAYPKTHERIRPRVLPYTRSFIDTPELAWAFHLVQVLVSLLLVVIGTNVAILIYARTAARTGELAIRTALGASRGRIVAQLFAEALMLSAAAAAVGVVGAWFALQQVNTFISRMGGEQLPFWMHFGITPAVILYVAGLAVVAAVIVGAVPAVKATRREVHSSLQHLGAGGSGMRLGKTWSFLIVAQVTVAVAILPAALLGVGRWVRLGSIEPPFAATQTVTATLFLDEQSVPEQRVETSRSVLRRVAQLGARKPDSAEHENNFAVRYANLRDELVRRLAGEPGVSHVVITSAIPGGEPKVRVEVDGAVTPATSDTPRSASYVVGVSRVGADFFDAFDIPLLAGRRFQAGDVATAATAVIVNRSFVQQVIDGRDPLGRRVRDVIRNRDGSMANANATWYDVVGVVSDFPQPADPSDLQPKIYHPLLPGDVHAMTLAARVRTATPAMFSSRLRELAVVVNPMLRLGNVTTLDATLRDGTAVTRLTLLGVALLTLSGLLLSAAGIYALMSFTVTKRRREIGIRSALGAGSRRVLMSVLSRAMGQIALGIALGVATAGLADRAMGGNLFDGRGIVLLPAVAGLMAAVGVLAAIGPARQALRIQPTDALRAE